LVFESRFYGASTACLVWIDMRFANIGMRISVKEQI